MNDDTRQMSKHSAIERVNALTQEQRDLALHNARVRMLGDEPQAGAEPQLNEFLARNSSKYPVQVTKWIRRLAIFMLVVAFLPSAMRMHEIGWTSFNQTIKDLASTTLAAWSIVLMAEVGQVIFSLAAAVLADAPDEKRRWWHIRISGQRMGLTFGAWVCTGIALAGNAEIVEPWKHPGLFIWLETFAPPLLVLVTAQVLKTQMLHSIEDRHAAQALFTNAHAAWLKDYQMRVREWQDAYANAEDHPKWMHYAANALRDALRTANRGSKAVLRELTDADWRILILRELHAEQWYVRAETQAVREAEAQQRDASANRSGASAGTHTGELDGTVREVNGAFVASCPHCEREFENATRRGAKNALVAHVRHAHRTASQETQMEVSANGRG